MSVLDYTQLLNLIRSRAECGTCQKDFAEKLGISPQYLSDVLKCRRDISPQLAKRLGYRKVVQFHKLTDDADTLRPSGPEDSGSKNDT